MRTTTFDELQRTERLRVWWSFLWRGFVITLCSAMGGGVAGFIIGFVIGVAASISGHSVHDPGLVLSIKLLGGAAGFVIGLALAYQYVRWLFNASLGGYRLVLVASDANAFLP